MASRRRAPQTEQQRLLGEAKASLAAAKRAVAWQKKRTQAQAAKVAAAKRKLKTLENAAARKAPGKAKAAAKARAGLAELQKTYAAMVARQKALGLDVLKAKRELGRLEALEKTAKAFEKSVRHKEVQRHRLLHRHLDGLLLNMNLPRELQMPAPPPPGVRTYAPAEMQLVSHFVCEWMREHLEAAAEELRGRAFVYRYPTSMEVDARLLFRAPADREMGELIATVADILRPMACTLTPVLGEQPAGDRVSSLYYHETFFQAAVLLYSQNHGFSSPGDRSRVLPGGIRELEFDGDWTTESHDHALQVLESIHDALLETADDRDEEVEIGWLELRLHWNHGHDRPRRTRVPPDRTSC